LSGPVGFRDVAEHGVMTAASNEAAGAAGRGRRHVPPLDEMTLGRCRGQAQ
jgi:hypothetical protein